MGTKQSATYATAEATNAYMDEAVPTQPARTVDMEFKIEGGRCESRWNQTLGRDETFLVLQNVQEINVDFMAIEAVLVKSGIEKATASTCIERFAMDLTNQLLAMALAKRMTRVG